MSRYHHKDNGKENNHHLKFDEPKFRALLKGDSDIFPDSCSDMLDVYTQYLKFLKQSGRDEDYGSLLAMAFSDKSIRHGGYRQDIRLFRILVTYAHHMPHDNDPLWVFDMMSEEQLCTRLAMFYLAVATIHESNGNLDAAKSKFEEALLLRERGQLINADKLDSMYQQFMGRHEKEFGSSQITTRRARSDEKDDVDKRKKGHYHHHHHHQQQQQQQYQQTLGFDKRLTHPNMKDEEYSLEEARAMLARYQPKQSSPPQWSLHHKITKEEEEERGNDKESEAEEDDMDMDEEEEHFHTLQPTIHTRMANHEIMSMFSGPIGDEEENIFEQKKRSNQFLHQQQLQQHQPAQKKQRFSIFEDGEDDEDDDEVNRDRESINKADYSRGRPFEIFEENDENSTPSLQVIRPTQSLDDVSEKINDVVHRYLQGDDNMKLNPFDSEFIASLSGVLAQTLDSMIQLSPTMVIPALDNEDIITLKNKMDSSGGVTIHLPDCSLDLLRSLQFDGSSAGFNAQFINASQSEESITVRVHQLQDSIIECHAIRQLEQHVKKAKSSLNRLPRLRNMYQYRNTGLVLLEQSTIGTLQDMLDVEAKSLDEHVVIFLTMELIKILHVLHHEANIIHTELRPSSLFIRHEDMATLDEECIGLKLGDMSKSMDLSILPKDVHFVVQSSRCHGYGSELFDNQKSDRTDQKWKYELDLLAVCGIVHRMLFGKEKEMCLTKDSVSQRWKPSERFKTTWKARDLWIKMFDSFLNVQSDTYCEATLREVLNMFEQYTEQNTSKMRLVPSLWRKNIAAIRDRAALNGFSV